MGMRRRSGRTRRSPPLGLTVRNIAVSALSVPLLAKQLFAWSLRDDIVLPFYGNQTEALRKGDR